MVSAGTELPDAGLMRETVFAGKLGLVPSDRTVNATKPLWVRICFTVSRELLAGIAGTVAIGTFIRTSIVDPLG